MNAEKWHEDKTEGESPPSLISAWARAGESTEFAAHLREAESDAGQHPKPAPDDEPDSQETSAALLRAIENTDFAARLRPPESEAGQPAPQPAPDQEPDSREFLTGATENREPAGNPRRAPHIVQPDLSTHSEPPQCDATLFAQAFPVAGPPRKQRVERPVSAAPRPVAPSSAIQQRGLPPDHPRDLTPTPETKPATTEKAPDGAHLGPSAPVEDSSSGASFTARLKGEMRYLAPKLGASARALLDSAGEHLSTWFQNLLSTPRPRDQRRSQRLVSPPLVAYYWTGGPPSPQVVADISSSGLYLATHDRWLPRTVISMALQRTDQESGTPGSWIAVDVMVVRLGGNGIGGAFIPSMPGLAEAAARRVGSGGDKETKKARETLERFVEHLAVSPKLKR